MRTLQNQLVEKGLSQARTQEIDSINTKTGNQPKERLSRRDWFEIMGTNRPTYGRKKGGAFRQR